jgi:hypothetical protein
MPDASLLNHSLSSGRLASWASAGEAEQQEDQDNPHRRTSLLSFPLV